MKIKNIYSSLVLTIALAALCIPPRAAARDLTNGTAAFKLGSSGIYGAYYVATIRTIYPAQIISYSGMDMLLLHAKLAGVPSTLDDSIILFLSSLGGGGSDGMAIVAAQEGDTVFGQKIKSFGDPIMPMATSSFIVYCSAKLLIEGTVTADNDDVLLSFPAPFFSGGSSPPPTGILREGDTSYLSGHRISMIDWFHCSPSNGVYAGVQLVQTASDDKKNALLNATTHTLLAYEGGPVNVNGTNKTILTISKPTQRKPVQGLTRVGNLFEQLGGGKSVSVLIQTTDHAKVIKVY